MYFMLYVFIVLLVGTCLLNMCVAALRHVWQQWARACCCVTRARHWQSPAQYHPSPPARQSTGSYQCCRSGIRRFGWNGSRLDVCTTDWERAVFPWQSSGVHRQWREIQRSCSTVRTSEETAPWSESRVVFSLWKTILPTRKFEKAWSSTCEWKTEAWLDQLRG